MSKRAKHQEQGPSRVSAEELDAAIAEAGLDRDEVVTANDLDILLAVTEIVSTDELAQALDTRRGVIVDALARARTALKAALGSGWIAASFQPVDFDGGDEAPAPAKKLPPSPAPTLRAALEGEPAAQGAGLPDASAV